MRPTPPATAINKMGTSDSRVEERRPAGGEIMMLSFRRHSIGSLVYCLKKKKKGERETEKYKATMIVWIIDAREGLWHLVRI